jgi:hypothetical protein
VTRIQAVFFGFDLGLCELKLVTFKCFLSLFVTGVLFGAVCCEGFQDGKVTIPKRLRELLEVKDGDYVRLGVVEVIKPKVKQRA